MKRVLLIGATGLVGSLVLENLLEEKWVGLVTILVRKDPGIKHKKLITEIVDFDNLQRYKKRIQGDVFISAFGSTIKKAGFDKSIFHKWDAEYPLEVAQYAHDNGCRHFSFVSALGASPKAFFFYSKTKGEIENRARKIGFKGVDIFRPSMLLGKRKESRFLEEIISKAVPLFNFLWKGPLSKIHPVNANDVALALIRASRDELSGVRIHYYNDIIQK